MTLFEHETEQIIATARQRTIGNAPAITVKELLAADIPHPLKTYFRAYVQSLLEQEQDQRRQSSRFNYEHPEVQSLQKQMNSILIMQYAVEQQEFLQQLDDGVHLIINYLVRPQWTLRNFVFAKDQTIPSSALISMLRYLGAYEYLRELIFSYVRQKHVVSFTDREFVITAWKLDGEYIRRKTGDELALLLQPLYDFITYPSRTENYALSVKGLIRYYEDKGLRVVAQRLDEEEKRGTEGLSLRALGALLEEIRTTSGELRVEPTWADIPPVQAETPQEPAEPVSKENPEPSSQPEEPFSIEALIDEGDRKRFIKKIFRHSENAFLEALHTLDSMPSWKQASVYIDEIFIRFGVDPYSNEAERFLDIARQRFYSSNQS